MHAFTKKLYVFSNLFLLRLFKEKSPRSHFNPAGVGFVLHDPSPIPHHIIHGSFDCEIDVGLVLRKFSNTGYHPGKGGHIMWSAINKATLDFQRGR